MCVCGDGPWHWCGRYTIVVHGGAPATFTTLNDVKANATWVPLVVAFFVCSAVAAAYTVLSKVFSGKQAAGAGAGADNVRPSSLAPPHPPYANPVLLTLEGGGVPHALFLWLLCLCGSFCGG